MFLKTDRLLDPNAEVDLTLCFPGGLGEHRIKGRVIRLVSMSDPDRAGEQLYGAAIRFVDLADELLKVIETVIETKPDGA